MEQPTADISNRKKNRWITALYFILSGIITASWSSRIPDVQQKLGLDDAAWGSVLFLLPVGLVTGLLLSSWLVARFGTTAIMIGGCLISCLLLTLLGIAGGQLQLMVTLFFFGAVRTILNMGVNTRSVEVQRLYNKPIVSTFHGLWSAACFLAAAIGTLMIVYNIVPLWHFAGIATFCLLLVLATRKAVANGRHIKPQQRPFFVKPDKYLLLLGLIAYCGMLAESTMFDWSVNYFEKVVEADKSMVTLGYTSFIIAMALGRLLGDRLIARFGAANMLMYNGVLMATGFGVAALFPSLLP
ncbi:MAG: MFS transporter, partial [Chitinophagaceae bacterium]